MDGSTHSVFTRKCTGKATDIRCSVLSYNMLPGIIYKSQDSSQWGLLVQ